MSVCVSQNFFTTDFLPSTEGNDLKCYLPFWYDELYFADQKFRMAAMTELSLTLNLMRNAYSVGTKFFNVTLDLMRIAYSVETKVLNVNFSMATACQVSDFRLLGASGWY